MTPNTDDDLKNLDRQISKLREQENWVQVLEGLLVGLLIVGVIGTVFLLPHSSDVEPDSRSESAQTDR